MIYFGETSGGTAATVKHCEQVQKPVLEVNGDTLNAAGAARLLPSLRRTRSRY